MEDESSYGWGASSVKPKPTVLPIGFKIWPGNLRMEPIKLHEESEQSKREITIKRVGFMMIK
jgi:hypothetical protein